MIFYKIVLLKLIKSNKHQLIITNHKMTKTLKSIIIKHNLGFFETPNIQLVKKTFADEIIEFADDLKKADSLRCATFKDLRLNNIKFIDINFTSSYFEKCLIENCIFNLTNIQDSEWENCVFKNCRFFKCNLIEIIGTQLIFENCKFIETQFSNAILKSCDFLKPRFQDVYPGSAVLIESKVSNSEKVIDIGKDVFLVNIIKQIKELDLD